MKSFLKKSALIAAVASMALASQAFAITIFSVSSGVQPSNVGTITLTQAGADNVNVSVTLLASNYGFLNTGGPHTPFAFNLSGTGSAGVSVTFTTPAAPGTPFVLNLAGGDNTPFGSFNVALDMPDVGNGSGAAYYGPLVGPDLVFTVTKTGLTEASFLNFSADLTNGNNTGSQFWSTPGTGVPDGGSTVALLGLALAGLAMVRRKITS